MLRWLQKSPNYQAVIARRALVYACAMHLVMIVILFLLPVCSTHVPTVIPVRVLNKNVVFKIVPFKTSGTRSVVRGSGQVKRSIARKKTATTKKQSPKKGQKKTAIAPQKRPKKLASKKPVPKKKPVVKKPVQKKAIQKKVVAKKPVPKKPVKQKPVLKKPVQSKKASLPKKPIVKQNSKPAPKKQKPIQKEKVDVRRDGSVSEGVEVIEVNRKEYQALQMQKDIGSQVSRYWSVPPGLSGTCDCLVRVYVAPDGSVRKTCLEKKSGVLAYDLAARAAALRVTYPRQVWGKNFVLDFSNRGEQ